MAQLEHIEAIEKRLWSAADGALGTKMLVALCVAAAIPVSMACANIRSFLA